MKKYCPKCCRKRSQKFFYHNKARKDGLESYCIICDRKRANESRFERRKTASGRLRSLISYAKDRARKSRLPFNITEKDLTIPERCPVFGIKLTMRIGRFNSPSLDRVIPEKGYVRGNVVVISRTANRLKNNGTLWEFEKIVEYLKNSISIKGLGDGN